MKIIGLLLGNFLLFTLYPCTPSLFKPTAKIVTVYEFLPRFWNVVRDRCRSQPINPESEKNRILLISLPVFILKIPKEKTEKKHIQYRWLEKKSY